MLRIRGKEFLQGIHRLGVAEVPAIAFDALYCVWGAVRHAEHPRVIVGFQHEEIASGEALFHQRRDEPEVGGVADPVPSRGKREPDGRHVVRDHEGFDADSAEIERGIVQKIEDVRRRLEVFFLGQRQHFLREIDRKAEFSCKSGASGRVDMVSMKMRDQDGAERGRIDADIFQSPADVDLGEPFIEEQIAFGAVDDCGVAVTAAAEDRAAERWRLDGGDWHGAITGRYPFRG